VSSEQRSPDGDDAIDRDTGGPGAGGGSAALAEVRRWLAVEPAGQGFLAVATDRGPRSYLLGPRTHVDGEIAMLDWRSAPLAEAFFRYRPGEPYEVEAGERTASGRVVARWVIAHHGEALIGDDRIIDGAGERAVARPQPIATPPADRSILPVLDPEQQAAVDLPADTSLVLDGEAGVGKTLVALFRIASLERRARAASRRFRALVLVPTEGLRRLARILAERLAVQRLEIAVTDDWLLGRARSGIFHHDVRHVVEIPERDIRIPRATIVKLHAGAQFHDPSLVITGIDRPLRGEPRFEAHLDTGL